MKVLIMAAGKSSRYGSVKCLEEINGTTVLLNLVSCIKEVKGLEPITLIDDSNEELISYCKEKGIPYHIIKKRKKGTADNIKEYFNKKDKEDIIVVWADVIPRKGFSALLNTYTKGRGRPAIQVAGVFKKNPYVSILLDGLGFPFDFHFSKLEGYSLKAGHHDQSCFYFSKEALNCIDDVPINSKKEYDILKLVSVAYSKNMTTTLLPLINDVVYSFNTKKEFDKIKKT